MPLWQPHQRKARLTMIRQAMEDKVPQLFTKMKKEGSLSQYVKTKEQAMMEEFDLMNDDIQTEMLKSSLPYMEKVQTHNMKIREAWEGVLANHLEFPTTG